MLSSVSTRSRSPGSTVTVAAWADESVWCTLPLFTWTGVTRLSSTVSAVSEPGIKLSAHHELVGEDGALAERDNRAGERALGVLGPGVYAQRAADALRGTRLVDVSVEGEQRLCCFDEATHGGGAHRHHPRRAALELHDEVRVDRGCVVEQRVKWRRVNHSDQ